MPSQVATGLVGNLYVNRLGSRNPRRPCVVHTRDPVVLALCAGFLDEVLREGWSKSYRKRVALLLYGFAISCQENICMNSFSNESILLRAA